VVVYGKSRSSSLRRSCLIREFVFFVSFLYAIGFVGNWVIPKSVDSGEPGPLGAAILIKAALFEAFSRFNTVSWPGKASRVGGPESSPNPGSGATFVLFASLILDLMYWQWRPMTDVIWSVQNPSLVTLL